MCIILLVLFLLLGTDAIVLHDVNTTVGESTVLPCSLKLDAPIGLKNIRFYWQDEKHRVLYSFNEGKEMTQHMDKAYRGRITAFLQDITAGNVSVLLTNTTLDDDHRVFQVFAAVLDSRRPGMYLQKHSKICEATLHVAVPYRSVSLTLNKEAMTAVCTSQRGFPAPLVKWELQYLVNNSQHFVDRRDVHTTAVMDPQDKLCNFSSTIHIPGGQYQTVTCYIHNPTLNVTLNASDVLNKGEAERSLHHWAVGLMAVVCLLVSAAE